MVFELETPIVTSNGVAVQIAIGQLVISLSLSGAMDDFLVNKLLDKIFRGQAYDYPSSVFLAAIKADGTEVGGGIGYTRAELQSTLTELSGTQGPGTTSASSGSTGRSSNNNLIAYPEPTAPWGDIKSVWVYSVLSSGDRLWRKDLVSQKSIDVGVVLSFQADQLGFTIS